MYICCDVISFRPYLFYLYFHIVAPPSGVHINTTKDYKLYRSATAKCQISTRGSQISDKIGDIHGDQINLLNKLV